MGNFDFSDCTIVVNSCDSYEDTWYPFFKILYEEWPECSSIPIILNTETKSFSFNGLDIRCLQPGKDKRKLSWSDRLIGTLKQIETNFVLLLMDDFFLSAPVNSERVKKVIDGMKKEPDIGVVNFVPAGDLFTAKDPTVEFAGDDYYERTRIVSRWVFLRDFFKSYFGKETNPCGQYLVNAQAAVWRREYLLKTLRPNESAWDWELFGTTRAFYHSERLLFEKYPSKAVFKYPYGGGITRGVWNKEMVVPIFLAHEIDIDYSIRGVRGKEWSYPRNKQLYKKAISLLSCFRKVLRR